MSPKRVALAGATGNLDRPVLRALLEANLSVTVLSRKGGGSSKIESHPNLITKEVDFTKKAAGVKRFIPAEFGMDSLNPLCAQLPVGAPKVATQKYLLGKHEINPSFTFTGISNGLFFDWGIEVGFIIDPFNHKATLYNGGDALFSATNLADVAQAILGVIHNQTSTANRIIYIHSTLTTQNKLIGYAKEKDGKEWAMTSKSTGDVRQEGMAELEKGAQADVDAAMNCFCICAMWGLAYGGDFSGHLDNALVGVKTLGENEVRSLVQSFLG